MTHHNPYQAPASQMTDVDGWGGYNTSAFYWFSGRIGRIRYMAYLTCYVFIIGVVLHFNRMALTNDLPSAVVSFSLLMVKVTPMMALYGLLSLTVRRLYDMSHLGWFALLVFVPAFNLILALYLLFAPGDIDANKYGLPSQPPTPLHFIGAVFLLIFVIFGLSIWGAS